jgi:nucleoside-diphosphate-sugar epimerase
VCSSDLDDGTPIRDIMHVDDVCSAIKLVCDVGNLNEIYNIGSGQPTTICDIIQTAKEYLRSKSTIKFKEAPEFHKIVQVKNFWFDTTKLQKLTFTQSISTQKIIEELCIN